jgi:hypothetical protein
MSTSEKYGADENYGNDKKNSKNGKTLGQLSDERVQFDYDMKRADREDKSKVLEAELETAQSKLDHDLNLKKMEARDQRDNAQIQMVIAGISGSIDKVVGIYTTVQKANLATVEARYKFILDLAKVDKDLAKHFISNNGDEIAGNAAQSAAEETIRELGRTMRGRE